jgi:hypothetical protein
MRPELRTQLRRQKARNQRRRSLALARFMDWPMIQVPLTRGQQRVANARLREALNNLWADMASTPHLRVNPK